MKEITVEEFKSIIDKNEEYQLIDVREPHEREIASIYGLNIPLANVPSRVEEFVKDKKVIVYCRSGKRSATAIHQIEEATGNENLYNLKGGILEWAEKIDNSIEKY